MVSPRHMIAYRARPGDRRRPDTGITTRERETTAISHQHCDINGGFMRIAIFGVAAIAAIVGSSSS
ncbi:MAG: hypothetical protein DMD26_17525, partial [Gemmatimonadetes bacterium]